MHIDTGIGMEEDCDNVHLPFHTGRTECSVTILEKRETERGGGGRGRWIKNGWRKSWCKKGGKWES